jgi:hypothetical protein
MDRLAIAASGLSAAAAQLGASAHNIANARTPRFAPACAAAQEALGGGAQVRPGPQAPERDAGLDPAVLAPSKTDLIAEAANRSAAAALYRANPLFPSAKRGGKSCVVARESARPSRVAGSSLRIPV